MTTDPVVLHPDDVHSTPWRNGAGRTRELAVQFTGDNPGPVCRISLADLVHDAEFSPFPGIDRLLVALGTLTLDIDGVPHVLAAGDRVRFRGEQQVRAVVPAPTQALNIMARRSWASADVTLRPARHPVTAGTTHSVPVGHLGCPSLDQMIADITVTIDHSSAEPPS